MIANLVNVPGVRSWINRHGQEMMTLTECGAAAILAGHDNFRRASTTVVARYKSDMNAGLWRDISQPILFDEGGELLDGQHRLNAFRQSNLSEISFVVVVVPKAAAPTIDAGMKRSAGQTFCHTYGGSIWEGKTIQAVAQKLFIGYRKSTGLNTPSVQQAMKIYEFYREGIDFAMALFGAKRRRGFTAVVRAAFARAFYHYQDTDRLIDGATRFYEQDFGDDTCEPLKLLRRILLECRDTPHRAVAYRKTSRAIAAWMERNNIQALYAATHELFSIPPMPELQAPTRAVDRADMLLRELERTKS